MNQLKITTFFKIIMERKGLKQPMQPQMRRGEKIQRMIFGYPDLDFFHMPRPNLDSEEYRVYYRVYVPKYHKP